MWGALATASGTAVPGGDDRLTRARRARGGGSVVMAGVSHRVAPLAHLERLAVPADHQAAFLGGLLAAGWDEAVVLSTCGRTEVYASGAHAGGGESLLAALAAHAGLPPASLPPAATVLDGHLAVAHLFRVAAGLDSWVVGEVDIQAQVRAAAAGAAGAGAFGPGLERLFTAATRTARRVHRETVLGSLGRSLGRRAADLGMARLGPENRHVIVLGTGRMARAVVERLGEAGIEPAVYGRDRSRAAGLAGDDRRAFALDHLRAGLAAADLVVCSTSAPHPLVGVADAREAMADRAAGGAARPLTIVDLSVPRNVESSIALVAGVHLVDLEGIGEDARDRHPLRAAIESGNAIVGEEAARFSRDARARQAGPLIAAMRARVERLCVEELRRAAGPTGGLGADDLERAARAIAGKLLHEPTMAAREAAATGDQRALVELRRLFAAGTPDVGAPPGVSGPAGPAPASAPGHAPGERRAPAARNGTGLAQRVPR